MTSKCRSCGAPIMWATTDAGKTMPIDVEPTPDGNIAIVAGKVCFSVPLELGDQPRYKSHFATCPNADKYRKR